jgi:hypothetical protein
MLKELITTLLVVCVMCGIVCITINLVKLNYPEPKKEVIYRYIPKTFDEQQKDLPNVSEVFKSMFTEQTPWVESVMTYDKRNHEAINKYFISQI